MTFAECRTADDFKLVNSYHVPVSITDLANCKQADLCDIQANQNAILA